MAVCDDQQAREIGHKRGGLRAHDQFAQYIAVEQAGDGEQRRCNGRPHRLAEDDKRADHDRRQSHQQFASRNVELAEMEGRARDHGSAEGEDRSHTAAGERGEDADTDDGGEMIDADDGMAEAGQKALREGLR